MFDDDNTPFEFDDDNRPGVIPEEILAMHPKAKHRDEFKTFDRRELFRMSDKALAEWQSQFETNEPQWRLAAHEWQRRLTAEQIRASMILGRQSAIFAVVASVAGAIVGAAITLLVQGLSK